MRRRRSGDRAAVFTDRANAARSRELTQPTLFVPPRRDDAELCWVRLREVGGHGPCADLPPVVLNEANHEIPRQYLDCSKARHCVAWHPRRTLEQELRVTIEWYRKALA
jgi:hypothetical protein